MDWTTFGVFLAAAVAVAAAPGPTVLQILAHSVSGDPKRPASLIAGSICANILMVLATVLGLSALILASQTAFTILRWVGAGYLMYLGIQYWRARSAAMAIGGAPAKPYRALFVQAALTSVTNPKGLVFYVAFLPQFVTPGPGSLIQLALLGATYVGICVVVDTGYALAGRSTARLFASPRAVRWKDRITGIALIGAGLSLLRYQRA